MRLGHAGELETRRSRETRNLVTLYLSAAQGLGEGIDEKYATVCQKHSTLVTHRSRALARAAMSMPSDWCQPCRCEKNDGHTWTTWSQCSECGIVREDMSTS